MARPVLWLLRLGLVVFLLGLAFSGQTFAQDAGEEAEGLTSDEYISTSKQNPLDVVQAKFFIKDNRWELFPHFYAGVLNNSYANRILFLSGMGLSYHISEAFFVEGVVDFFPSFPRDQYDDLKSLTKELARNVEPGEEIQTVPKEFAIAAIGVGISPIYGKINLVSSYVQNFDVSFVGGLARLGIYMDRYQLTGYDEYGRTIIAGPLDPRETQWYWSGNLGLAIRFFLTHWLTLRADARFYGYIDTDVVDYASPYIENGVTNYPYKSVFRESFILAVGLSGFLPWQH